MDKDYLEKMTGEVEEEAVPRRMYIRKEDVGEHGYTLKCPGCVSISRRTSRQEHSAECRRRLEKELGVTDRAKRASKRVNEYVDKKMEEDEKVREKRSRGMLHAIRGSREKMMKENSMDDGTEANEKWSRSMLHAIHCAREKMMQENSMDDGTEKSVDRAEKRKRDVDDDVADGRTKPGGG